MKNNQGIGQCIKIRGERLYTGFVFYAAVASTAFSAVSAAIVDVVYKSHSCRRPPTFSSHFFLIENRMQSVAHAKSLNDFFSMTVWNFQSMD